MHERRSLRGFLRWNKVHQRQSMTKLSRMARTFTIALGSLLAAAALLFALPVAASAQSAGDEQYADPFGEVPDEGGSDPQEDPNAGNGGSGGQGGGSAPSGGGSDTPVEEVPEATSTEAPDSTTGSTEATTSVDGGEELARTGLPADVLLLLGISLLCAGVSMRLFLRPAHWREAP